MKNVVKRFCKASLVVQVMLVAMFFMTGASLLYACTETEEDIKDRATDEKDLRDAEYADLVATTFSRAAAAIARAAAVTAGADEQCLEDGDDAVTTGEISLAEGDDALIAGAADRALGAADYALGDIYWAIPACVSAVISYQAAYNHYSDSGWDFWDALVAYDDAEMNFLEAINLYLACHPE